MKESIKKRINAEKEVLGARHGENIRDLGVKYDRNLTSKKEEARIHNDARKTKEEGESAVGHYSQLQDLKFELQRYRL